MSRGIRRVIRRRRFRLQRVRSYLKKHNILPAEKVDHLYDVPSAIDIYELRKRALTEKVTAEEWARLLIFFAKHRGFKSNRKKASGDADEGEMLKAIAANAEILKITAPSVKCFVIMKNSGSGKGTGTVPIISQ